ncbi:MAG: hypothetical protein AAFZ07_24365 [Actinomycetota bacterium]
MRSLRPSRPAVLGGVGVLVILLLVGVFVSSERAGRLGSDESRASGDDERGSVLFGAKWVPLDRGDEVAVELLELDGWDVEIRQVTDPAHLPVDDTAAFDVVVLSSSIDSVNITHLGATPVPLVTWEPYHHDDMGSFTHNGPSPQHLSFSVDGTHPLAAALGLDGEVAVAAWAPTAAGGGEPVDGVVPIGVFPDGLIGWYELPAGAALTDGSPAPACRIGLPFNDKASMMRGLTDEGAAVLTGSIRYAAAGCRIDGADLGGLGDLGDLDEPVPTTTTTVAATTTVATTTTTEPAADAPPPATVPDDDPDPEAPTDTGSASGEGAPERASVFVVDDDGRPVLLVSVGEPISASGGDGGGTVVAATAARASWWTVTARGEVTAHGAGRHLGDLAAVPLNEPIVTALATPSGEGYWLVASDGGVFAFGDAGFHGSLGSIRLNAPIETGVATPSGEGYWLVASDGGVFAFGDADFFGSLGSLVLNAPIATGSFTSTGGGYWLVATDGGVFSFGDATFHGSEADSGRSWRLLAPHLDGSGYTLVATDGVTSVHGAALEVPADVVADGARPVSTIVLTGDASSLE